MTQSTIEYKLYRLFFCIVIQIIVLVVRLWRHSIRIWTADGCIWSLVSSRLPIFLEARRAPSADTASHLILCCHDTWRPDSLHIKRSKMRSLRSVVLWYGARSGDCELWLDVYLSSSCCKFPSWVPRFHEKRTWRWWDRKCIHVVCALVCVQTVWLFIYKFFHIQIEFFYRVPLIL